MYLEQLALKSFTRKCLREAHEADLRGDYVMARSLRKSVVDVTMEECRAALPAPAPAPVDAKTAQKRDEARGTAATILSVFNPGMMAHKPE